MKSAVSGWCSGQRAALPRGSRRGSESEGAGLLTSPEIRQTRRIKVAQAGDRVGRERKDGHTRERSVHLCRSRSAQGGVDSLARTGSEGHKTREVRCSGGGHARRGRAAQEEKELRSVDVPAVGLAPGGRLTGTRTRRSASGQTAVTGVSQESSCAVRSSVGDGQGSIWAEGERGNAVPTCACAAERRAGQPRGSTPPTRAPPRRPPERSHCSLTSHLHAQHCDSSSKRPAHEQHAPSIAPHFLAGKYRVAAHPPARRPHNAHITRPPRSNFLPV